MQVKWEILLGILLALTPNLAITVFGFTCSVSSTNMDFGIINPYDYVAETTKGSVSVTCSPDVKEEQVSYTVTFNTGNSKSNTARKLYKNDTTVLSYNIFDSGGHVNIYGDGTNGTMQITNKYDIHDVPQTDVFIIYGKIPVQPVSLEGVYTDSLTITLSY